MEPIVSRVKPIEGFHIETIDGHVYDEKVTNVVPSKSYVNLFKVKFEGKDKWYDVIWLKRLDD